MNEITKVIELNDRKIWMVQVANFIIQVSDFIIAFLKFRDVISLWQLLSQYYTNLVNLIQD